MKKIKNEIIFIICIVIFIIILFYYYHTNIVKYEKYENNEKFILITYETDSKNPHLQNLINQMDKYNFNYIILGNNEKWDGWFGRLKKYQEYIDTLDNNTYILLCDARDVLINNKTSSIFLQKAKELYKKNNNKLIVGTEEGCCTGDENNIRHRSYKIPDKSISLHQEYRNHMEKKTYEIDPNYKHKFYYLNFGLLFGRAKDFKNIFNKMNIQPGEDDQLLLQKLYYEEPELLYPDIKQELLSNSLVNGDCSYEYNDENNSFINKKTDTYPYIIQTPGKNWECYKKIANQIIDNPSYL